MKTPEQRERDNAVARDYRARHRDDPEYRERKRGWDATSRRKHADANKARDAASYAALSVDPEWRRQRNEKARAREYRRLDEVRAGQRASRARRMKDPDYAAAQEAQRMAFLARRPLYKTWMGMKQRCLNPKAPKWPHYGGRGIRIHEPWVESYEAFEADILALIGPRPAGMTLDRIDVDGHYEPGNLRWATSIEQRANRRHREDA